MSAPTRRFVPSLLTTVVSVAMYFVAAALVLTPILVVSGANVGLHVDFSGPAIEAGSGAAMSIPVFVEIDPARQGATAPSLGVERAELRDLRGALRFPPRRGVLFAVNVAILLGSLLLLLWVLWQLRSLFRTLRDGRPFARANARRVRNIAWALIAGELAGAAVTFYETSYAASHFSATGVTFAAHPDLDLFTIFNGLIVLALAEVFREGTRLADEQSLTI